MPSLQRCPHCSSSVPQGARFCQQCGKDTTKSGGLGFKALVIGLVVLVVALGGIVTMQLTAPRQAAPPAGNQAAAGYVEGAGKFPTWLVHADRQIQEDYVWASTHLAELQYIPCYCGCAPIGHTDNFSCYFTRDKNGTITGYDDHAVG